MRLIDAILAELDQETNATRNLLNRIPEEKLTWKPHPKSMNLGELALHIASIPAGISEVACLDRFELPDFKTRPDPKNKREVIEMLEESVRAAKSKLAPLDDARLMETWTGTRNGKEVMAFPRIGVIRTILLNHWYHHRGQLDVYLRLLNVPLPAIYGPSADESPFADTPATTAGAR
ncbi:MAG TPA: DinB family protein [bacterium]|nr:DinB family protein [bacterium]